MSLPAAMGFAPRRALSLLSLVLLSCCGCGSLNQPASASFASVIIPNRSVEEIRLATVAVFSEAGYERFQTPAGDLVFEKEGTRMNQIAQGGWLQDSPTRERVRTEIVSLPDGAHRLQCKAFIVRHSGDSFFEEEVPLHKPRSGSYQNKLDEIKRRLGS